MTAKTEHIFAQGCEWGFLGWDELCHYQLEGKKKCPQARLLLTVAAGDGGLGQKAEEHPCPSGSKSHSGYHL